MTSPANWPDEARLDVDSGPDLAEVNEQVSDSRIAEVAVLDPKAQLNRCMVELEQKELLIKKLQKQAFAKDLEISRLKKSQVREDQLNQRSNGRLRMLCTSKQNKVCFRVNSLIQSHSLSYMLQLDKAGKKLTNPTV